MSKRSTSRKLAIQMLYQIKVGKATTEQAKEFVFNTGKYHEDTKEFAGQLLDGVLEQDENLTKIINKYSIDWPSERMSKVDLCILKLALYEIEYLKEAAFSVSINEAMELAKKFSTDEARIFINGILGKYIEHKK